MRLTILFLLISASISHLLKFSTIFNRKNRCIKQKLSIDDKNSPKILTKYKICYVKQKRNSYSTICGCSI